MIFNLIFPVWMLFYFIPFLIFIAIVGNVAIDIGVVKFMTRNTAEYFGYFKWNILFTILFGFLADIIGGIALTLTYEITPSSINYFHIWSNPISVIVHVVAILFVGVLIYFFNYWNYSSSNLTKQEVIRLSLALAIITMPYTFLISASIYY